MWVVYSDLVEWLIVSHNLGGGYWRVLWSGVRRGFEVEGTDTRTARNERVYLL